MYSLEELFRNSTHKSSAFSTEAVNFLEARIFTKTQRSSEVPFIKCQIRNKEIRLTPEEAVRQLYVYELIHKEGYPPERIRLEYPIHIGREIKRADIVILDSEAAYIIVEVKKPHLLEGKEQLKSYCNASGAAIGIWTNGEELSYYHRKEPNIFESLDRIPKESETLKDVLSERWTISDLELKDRLKDGRKTLKALIQEMENEVLANAGVDAFEEVFKLIYTKLFDELQSARDTSRFLEFRNYAGDDKNADQILKRKIQALFEQAKAKWPGVFDVKAEIALMPSHLAVCISTLQEVKLFNSSLDVVDDAFEYLMNKSQKGEKGQFFTPRYVIDMCVKMLNPQKHEFMIDTAAGSCGFPVHTMFYVWRSILKEKGSEQSSLFTAEKKPPECEDYVKEKVFAIDFDEKAVRVARTLNLIAGDGRTNVLHLNTLDYGNWKQVTENFAWQSVYFDGWKGLRGRCAIDGQYRDFTFDIVMANPPFAGDIKESKTISRYELAKNSKGDFVSKIGRDILFIERNLQFLKPGGRMAIILPQGRFNNSSDKYIRDFIAGQCRILAVIGLHVNVFKPHTGTKTSVLLVQKWDDELCPRREDYPVFFATMRKPGKDNSGDKIFRKDSRGRTLLDAHNHPIVEHDLYNHEGLSEDGIAEAFIEFAKREGLSFFVGARPFDEKYYNELTDGLECCEVMLSETSERLDSEFYKKGDIALLSKLRSLNAESLDGLVNVITDGTHFTPSYVDGGIPFLSALNIKRGYIDFGAGHQHITIDEHKKLCRRVHPREGDILMRKIGTGERLACVVPEYACEFSIFVSIALIRARINPQYLAAFINTRYGQTQLLRLNKGINQPDLHLEDIQKLLVPLFSEKFYDAISTITLKAQSFRQEANELYTSAQSSLQAALHFDPSAISSQNTAVISFSAMMETGRLDAEYFMPKYDDILAQLQDASTIEESCTIHGANFKPKPEVMYDYIELADVGPYGNITSTTRAEGRNLPTRARRLVHAGQVIVSSIEGSLQSCALVTSEHDGALCSTGFYVMTSKEYNPETLLMLFKSQLVQDMLKRGCSGTILSAISDDELRKIRLPRIEHNTQRNIAEHVQNSFILRRKSEKLINIAVRSVELAIEHDENFAYDYIMTEEEKFHEPN